MTMATKQGILYVQSRITSPNLSPKHFKQWYENICIPDVLATSGIEFVFRYQSISSDNMNGQYLAIYPVKGVKWLSSDDFFSIPLHTEILPNESKAIHDLAHFQIRYYETVDSKPTDEFQGPLKFIVTVAFDSETEELAKLYVVSTSTGSTPVRSSLSKVDSMPSLGPENKEIYFPTYLAILSSNM